MHLSAGRGGIGQVPYETFPHDQTIMTGHHIILEMTVLMTVMQEFNPRKKAKKLHDIDHQPLSVTKQLVAETGHNYSFLRHFRNCPM